MTPSENNNAFKKSTLIESNDRKNGNRSILKKPFKENRTGKLIYSKISPGKIHTKSVT